MSAERQDRLTQWRHALAGYKSEINLAAFAAERYGYQLRPKESYRGVKVLKHEAMNHKIVVARNREDGHWVYFSIEIPDAGDRQRRGLDRRGDNGTIVDFIRHREPDAGMREVHAECCKWLGRPDLSHAADYYIEPMQAAQRDRARVAAEYDAAKSGAWSRYLAERGLQAKTLSDPRFRDTWRLGQYGNVLFPHWDERGLSGFEKKNRGFTGFSVGGTKGLWHSRIQSSDRVMVVAESAIDAMSYHQLYPRRDARYFSIGGQANPEQLELLPRAGAKMPEGSRIIVAFDNDEMDNPRVEHLVATVRGLLMRPGIELLRHAPEQRPGIKDWNDVVMRNREQGLGR